MATSLSWRDLTFGPGSGEKTVSIEGWEELPAARYDNLSRARAHGSHSSPVWSDQRLVTVTATYASPEERDANLLALQRSMAFGVAEEPLSITLAGRTLSASAQLLRCTPTIDSGSWRFGLVGWVAQWRCPDPLRYGPVQTATTGLPTSGGGLAYPLTYPLSYGTPGNSGQVTLSNGGNADAGIVFNVAGGNAGGLPSGFEISAAGQRITYPTAVPAGQTVTVDTAEGTVVVEGTADRRGQLTNADWLLIPAGGSLTVQFTSLGGALDAGSLLTATWREANW